MSAATRHPPCLCAAGCSHHYTAHQTVRATTPRVALFVGLASMWPGSDFGLCDGCVASRADVCVCVSSSSSSSLLLLLVCYRPTGWMLMHFFIIGAVAMFGSATLPPLPPHVRVSYAHVAVDFAWAALPPLPLAPPTGAKSHADGCIAAPKLHPAAPLGCAGSGSPWSGRGVPCFSRSLPFGTQPSSNTTTPRSTRSRTNWTTAKRTFAGRSAWRFLRRHWPRPATRSVMQPGGDRVLSTGWFLVGGVSPWRWCNRRMTPIPPLFLSPRSFPPLALAFASAPQDEVRRAHQGHGGTVARVAGCGHLANQRRLLCPSGKPTARAKNSGGFSKRDSKLRRGKGRGQTERDR